MSDGGSGPYAAVGRVRALDALRGVAALVVVMHHCMLVTPALGTGLPLVRWSWEWWATHTPLHLLWAGDEAVVVFFVLSGFVLTLPALSVSVSVSRRGWRGYYVRRALRLYLPVWASLLFALLLAAVVPRVAAPGQSRWVHERGGPADGWRVVLEALLATPTPTVNGVLWSLHYELLFSLLLPIYLWFGLVARRWWAVKLLVMLGSTAAGSFFDLALLIWMPMFAVGVVLAVERIPMAAFAGRLRPQVWNAMFVAAVLLLLARWFGAPGYAALATVGSMLLIVGLQARGERLARSRSLAWLGTRSFSLYLVHEPIVAAVALATGATSPWVPLVVAVPLSLAAAAGLYRAAEQPAQRLARRAGRPCDRDPVATRS